MRGVDGCCAGVGRLALHGPDVALRPVRQAQPDLQPRAAGLCAQGFGVGEVVVVGGAAWIETAEGVDPPAADRGASMDGLVVHPAIMARRVRRRSAELERKNR
jgi:hypothetical protein